MYIHSYIPISGSVDADVDCCGAVIITGVTDPCGTGASSTDSSTVKQSKYCMATDVYKRNMCHTYVCT